LPLRELRTDSLDEPAHFIQCLGGVAPIPTGSGSAAGRLGQVEKGLCHFQLGLQKLNE
jgi:hypothetical protein